MGLASCRRHWLAPLSMASCRTSASLSMLSLLTVVSTETLIPSATNRPIVAMVRAKLPTARILSWISRGPSTLGAKLHIPASRARRAISDAASSLR
jgi:hypothetical protein